LLLQPSPETLDRHALALQDSVRASMSPAINLDTLSVGQRDSLVSLARELTGKAVTQVGMAVMFIGLLTLAVYLAVPTALIAITAVWLRERKKQSGDHAGAGA
jgi:hypothetical protein